MDINTTDDIATIAGFEALFANIVGVVLAIAGILLFIMLILGGIRFLQSGADASKAEAAKKTLTSAITWVIFIILAFLLLVFIQELTGLSVTNFVVVQP